MTDVAKHLDSATQAQKGELEKIRQIVREIVPDAEEVISYGIPAFKYNKRPLIYYAAHKNHMSIYPASDQMVESVGQELARFRTGKGTLQFTENNPIPARLIKEIINFRLTEISHGLND